MDDDVKQVLGMLVAVLAAVALAVWMNARSERDCRGRGGQVVSQPGRASLCIERGGR